MLYKLALRNIFRQRIRSVVTLVAIVFGVAGLILSGGFVKDIFVQLGEAIIQSETGHAQVFREGFREKGSRQPDRYLINDPGPIAARIATSPLVRDVSSRLSFSGLLNNGKRDLAVIGEGVEPDKEARLGTFLKMVSGRTLTEADTFGMIVGQGVAQSLALQVGDQVTVLVNTTGGALNTVDVEVIGIFQSFSRDFDARAVRIPLAAAQELLATPGANQLIISLHQTRDTDDALAAIKAQLSGSGLEAYSWKQLSDFYEKTLQLYDRQFGVLQVIILVMVLLSVANTVNMSAFERLGEFGTLQALGNRQRDVFRLILVENTFLGLMGGTLGAVIGVALALAISAIGIPMPPPPSANTGYTAMIRLDVANVATAFLIGVVATALAAIFPARRVSRTELVEALRQRT
ncbi:ABC transporter permease [Thauera sp.]|uniref:ABC transporter permease n=1 Tax=Thauera sp. TaxID=1905334 RepID=UPI002628B006|nr:ABC transporter permease [Thauera sp.]